jgi:hypothetical protein
MAHMMTMNRKWILLSVMAFSFANALSQDAHSRIHWKGLAFLGGAGEFKHSGNYCGIYRTASDLEAGTLSLAIDCKTEDHRLKPGFVRDQSAIKVVRDGESQNYLKREIHGYRDCRGNEFHFFDGKTYQLINPGETIRLYVVYKPNGKQRVAKYYFSTQSSESPIPLSLQNLRMAFSDEPAFLEKLDLLAKNNTQLIRHRSLINHARSHALASH